MKLRKVRLWTCCKYCSKPVLFSARLAFYSREGAGVIHYGCWPLGARPKQRRQSMNSLVAWFLDAVGLSKKQSPAVDVEPVATEKLDTGYMKSEWTPTIPHCHETLDEETG